MKKINILFLTITTFVTFVICMCLTGCKGEFKLSETPQSRKIFNVNGCGIYYVEVTHDNHEYLMSSHGGIIHKVNCKFCTNKRNER